jgi:hypothetical protein
LAAVFTPRKTNHHFEKNSSTRRTINLAPQSHSSGTAARQPQARKTMPAFTISPAAPAAPGHSTGPRTPAGKAASSQNARKHGCCSSLVLQPGEDAEEWQALQASFIDEYQALNSPAALPLAIRAAEARWAMQRARNQFDQVQCEIYAEQPDCCRWTTQHHQRYQRFQRYFTAADRAFQRAFLDLERLRTAYFKERKIAFNEEIALTRQAHRQRKHTLDLQLIEAKIDLCHSKKAKPPAASEGKAQLNVNPPLIAGDRLRPEAAGN